MGDIFSWQPLWNETSRKHLIASVRQDHGEFMESSGTIIINLQRRLGMCMWMNGE